MKLHLEQTSEGILDICKFLIDFDADAKIKIKKFTTDVLETLFASVKYNQPNPTAAEAFDRLRMLNMQQSNVLRNDRKSNCAPIAHTQVAESTALQMRQVDAILPREHVNYSNCSLEFFKTIEKHMHWESMRHPIVNSCLESILLDRESQLELNQIYKDMKSMVDIFVLM